MLNMQRGAALAEVGQIEDSIGMIRKTIDLCERFGALYHLGPLYNCLGYCYGEIYQPAKAWEFNLRSEEIARSLFEKYPMGRRHWGHALGNAEASLAENSLDQGNPDAALERIEAIEQEEPVKTLTITATSGNPG